MTDRRVSQRFRERVREAACERFSTVLGPGADAHHEEHVHIDLAQRRGGYRLCQWDIRVPVVAVPLPPRRPLPRGEPKPRQRRL